MIALVVACSKNRVIGNNGRIPWKIPGEQKRFKELTTGHVVVMGRRSYEEIGKPLPNRTTIVVSKTKEFKGNNCHTVKSLQEAIRLAGDKDVFISGGARLYKEAIPLVEKMYITEVGLKIYGDTFFPEFQKELFNKKIEKVVNGDISYKYITYERKCSIN